MHGHLGLTTAILGLPQPPLVHNSHPGLIKCHHGLTTAILGTPQSSCAHHGLPGYTTTTLSSASHNVLTMGIMGLARPSWTHYYQTTWACHNHLWLTLPFWAHYGYNGLTTVTLALLNHHWDLHNCNVHGTTCGSDDAILWIALLWSSSMGYSTHDPCWW